ncbi:MAG TPA: hypothetical protein VFM49_31005 [Chloroflexia bacterium]|nr:hypothetical protein [Chloroflexia bacterium]
MSQNMQQPSQQPQSGKYPPDTPITQMVGPELASALQPYQKITKGDLLAMGGIGRADKVPPEAFGITHQDLRTIQDVFQTQEEVMEVTGHLVSAEDGGGVNCCCCPCTCCCAAAQQEPIRPLN